MQGREWTPMPISTPKSRGRAQALPDFEEHRLRTIVRV